jgi:hypothetical protein
VVENRKLCPISLHFRVESLVGRPVVTNVALLDMTRLNVLLCGITLLSMGLRNVGLLDIRVFVNRLRVLLDVMLPAALTDLVEGSSDKVHNSAENSENKGTPGQVAVIIRGIGIILEDTRNTPCIITSSRASRAAIRSRKNRNSNETSNKGNVQKDPQPAKPSRATTLEKQRKDHANKSVQDSCGKDTLNRAKGSADPTSGLAELQIA